jgi:hypothetical protein
MTDKNKYIAKTINGPEVELTQATIIRSNNLYPFGKHNYAIYETPDGHFVKGMNSGEREIMLTSYELIEEKEARNYSHPYYRED